MRRLLLGSLLLLLASASCTRERGPDRPVHTGPPLAPANASAAVSPDTLPGAQLFLPPPERCAQPATERQNAPDFDDAAPLSVKAVPAGIAMEAGGAKAGRVLLAIAELAHEPMHVEGFGASVRIYAHVSGLPREALIASVLRVAGLVAYHEEDRAPVMLDAEGAERRHRAWVLSNLELAPLETRLIPARHPMEIAAVLARLLLPCRGEIVAVPVRSVLVSRAYSSSQEVMEAVVAAADAEPSKPFQVEATGRVARTTFAVPEPHRRACPSIPPRAAPDLARGALASEGGAAGALLRELARRRGEDVVVGCGGDRAVFFRGEGDVEEVAARLGLRKLDENMYADGAVESASRWGDVAPDPSYHVRAFVVSDAPEVALVAERHIAPWGSAVAYRPASMVMVGAADPDLSTVERLVGAWSELPIPGAPAAPRR